LFTLIGELSIAKNLSKVELETPAAFAAI